MAAYGTDLEFQAWLNDNGLTLPSDAPSLEVLRTIGSGYIDSAYEHKLHCSSRTDGLMQDLAWPRKGHKGIQDDEIPKQWVTASYRAGYLEAAQRGWATGTRDVARQTRREKVDVIEREYFSSEDAGASGNVPAGMASDGMIEGLVSMLFCPDGQRYNWCMVI